MVRGGLTLLMVALALAPLACGASEYAGGGDGDRVCDPDAGDCGALGAVNDNPEDGEGDLARDFEQAACDSLVVRSCGSAGLDCEGEPGCVAARLLAEHVPEECTAALEDERAYPPCLASPCDLLVTKVCGGDEESGACAELSSCAPAASLKNADAVDECRAALEDETLFAPCPEGT